MSPDPRYEHEKNFELTHLVAGNSPTPATVCASQAPDKFFVFLGGNVSVLAASGIHTILTMGRDSNGKPLAMFSISNSDRGISITKLLIYGRDGKIITSIDSDEYWTNSNFHSKKISPSQLLVYDDQEQEVLNVDFLNNHALKITGIFRHPKMRPLKISDLQMSFGNGNFIKGGCQTDVMGSAFRFDGPPL